MAIAQTTPDNGAEASADVRFDERVAQLQEEIAAQRREIEMLEGRVEAGAAAGLNARIFATRLDRAEVELFDMMLRLAREVAEARDDGTDVSAYLGDVTGSLDALPARAVAAARAIQQRMVLTTGTEAPADIILADQQLAAEMAEVNAVYESLISYLDVAAGFDVDTDRVREQLVGLLRSSAADRSVLLELGKDEALKLKTAVTTLPDDQELAARLAAIEQRINVASDALQAVVALMNRLDLNTDRYRQQLLASTGEITTDVLDIGFMAGLVADWTNSVTDIVRQEGPRMVFSVLLAVILLLAFMQIGKIVQRVVERALSSQKVHLSSLLRKMILSTVRNVIVVIGTLIALSQLGISLGPLLAGLGIAGFIVGFALQDSLSNFASGLMILIYRPFDVGDFVEVTGVKGKVDSMTMVNTTFLTIDNQKLVVPNNTIWQSVIANYTDQSTRRVDLVFGISYGDDIDKAEDVIRGVLADYDKILETPAPVIKVGELADSSVNLIVRPWVLTADYWDTYWDLTKLVKQAFDREGITIPFPQRDVHVAREGGNSG